MVVSPTLEVHDLDTGAAAFAAAGLDGTPTETVTAVMHGTLCEGGGKRPSRLCGWLGAREYGSGKP